MEGMDRISQLPECILHHILSLLSSKEAAQTSVLSKTWYRTWQLFPILDFSQFDFEEESYSPFQQLREARGKLKECVDKRLQRFCDQKMSIKVFKLDWGPVNGEMCSVVDKWIETATKCQVKHLDLRLRDPIFRYTLPEVVFSARWMETLRLSECIFNQPSASFILRLHSLRSVILEMVRVNDEIIHKLTSECTLLEHLSLSKCGGLKRFVIPGTLFKLKSLGTRWWWDPDFETIEISAPHLEEFLLLRESPCEFLLLRESPCEIKVIDCPYLKKLSLSGVLFSPKKFRFVERLSLSKIYVNEEIIKELNSECPLLEHFSLSGCWGLKYFRVCNRLHLQTIFLSSRGLECIEISAHHLRILTLNLPTKSPLKINMIDCQNLQSLSLSRIMFTAGEFHNLISRLPRLENLKLIECNQVKFSSEVLKDLTLHGNDMSEAIEIYAPNMEYSQYSGTDVPSAYSICVPCRWYIRLTLSDDALDHLGTYRISQFLRTVNHVCRLHLSFHDLFDPPNLVSQELFHMLNSSEISSSLPCEVDEMCLSVSPDVTEYPVLDGLFWICRPTKLTVFEADEMNGSGFVKRACQKMVERDTNCCASAHIKCWRHYLKDIRLLGFDSAGVAPEKPQNLDFLFDGSSGRPLKWVNFHLEWHSHDDIFNK